MTCSPARLLTLSTLLVLLAFPVLSLAQKEPGDPVPTPSPQGGTPVAPEAVPQTRTDDGFISLTQIRGLEEAGESSNFAVLFNNLYLLCVGAGAILAVLQVLRGGLTYMLSDSITNKKEARDTIVMALVGLLLVLSPTIVFGIIDPRILSLSVDFSPLRPERVPSQTPGNGAPSGEADAPPTEGTNEPAEPESSVVRWEYSIPAGDYFFVLGGPASNNETACYFMYAGSAETLEQCEADRTALEQGLEEGAQHEGGSAQVVHYYPCTQADGSPVVVQVTTDLDKCSI